MKLDQLSNNITKRVKRVDHDELLPEIAHQLEEIGFIPGERVMVMRRNLLGGDPLMVRVGLSTFALRKKEAALIEVEDLSDHD
jgi:ferrous iron transport protein A